MMKDSTKRTGELSVFVSLQELLNLKAGARQFSLSSFKIKSSNGGQRFSRLLARGMEFAESRRYLPGDDVRNIDWRVTARTGKAHTKLFTVEKERQVILSVDMRSSMFFATKGVFKSVQAALMMGYVGWNAAENGDRLGGLIFDDAGFFECKPALGKKGLLPFLQGLAERTKADAKKQSPSSLSKTLNMDQAIGNLKKMATPGSLVFVVSDFRHLSSFAKDLLIQISRHCDLCLCFIYDTLEANFPKNGQYPVTDGNRDQKLNVNYHKDLEKYRQQFLERRNNVASLSNQRHVHFMECSTENECLNLLTNVF